MWHYIHIVQILGTTYKGKPLYYISNKVHMEFQILYLEQQLKSKSLKDF